VLRASNAAAAAAVAFCLGLTCASSRSCVPPSSALGSASSPDPLPPSLPQPAMAAQNPNQLPQTQTTADAQSCDIFGQTPAIPPHPLSLLPPFLSSPGGRGVSRDGHGIMDGSGSSRARPATSPWSGRPPGSSPRSVRASPSGPARSPRVRGASHAAAAARRPSRRWEGGLRCSWR
jgi:hypothetical protein